MAARLKGPIFTGGLPWSCLSQISGGRNVSTCPMCDLPVTGKIIVYKYVGTVRDDREETTGMTRGESYLRRESKKVICREH